MWRPLLRLALASACAAVSTSAAEVAGVILAAQGLPVPGPRIWISGAQEQTAQNDPSGRFPISNVLPGDYELTVRAPGMSDHRRPLQVAEGPLALRLALEVASANDSVMVEERLSQIDLSSDASLEPVQFSQADLEGLPIKNGGLLQALSLLLKPAGGGSPTLILDGVERSDAVLTPAVIRSIKFGGNTYPAEFASPGKSGIEIETRSGADRGHGSLAVGGRNARFDVRNPLAASRLPFSRQGYETSPGGPLASGVAILLVINWEAQRDDVPVVAVLPGGSRPSNFLSPSARGVVAGRFDWQFDPAHRTAIRYELKHDSALRQTAGGFVLPEHGLDRPHRDYRIELHHLRLLSPNTINTVRLSLGTNSDRTTPVLDAPAVRVAGAFAGGGAQRAAWRHDPRVELLDTLASERGRISFRMGIDIRDHSFDRSAARNLGGAWRFGSLAEYVAGRPVSLLFAEGDPLVRPHQTETAWVVQREVRWRRVAPFAGARHEFQSGLRRYAHMAPRASLAWSPRQATVLRAGAGAFHEHRKPDLIERTLRSNGSHRREFLLLEPRYPRPAVAAHRGLTRWQLDPGQRLPLSLQTSVTLERRLNARGALAADVTLQPGLRLYRVVNLNEAAPGSAQRPWPELGNLHQIETSASCPNHSSSVAVQFHAAKRVQLRAQYSFSRMRDDTEGPFALPASSRGLRAEWGPFMHDQPHRLAAVARASFGWKLDLATVTSMRSGLPYSVLCGVDSNRDGLLTDRPPGVPRKIRRGKAQFALDMGIARIFARQLGDQKIEIEAAADSFITFNRPITRAGTASSIRAVSLSRSLRLRAGKYRALSVFDSSRAGKDHQS